MNELSLFSGAGGGLLGTKLLGFRAVGYVENNTYCQQILAQRIEDGFLDEAPIFGDIDDFIESGASKKYKGYVDVVTAGFPCQPFSVAGKKKGQDDERNKWPQTIQCIRDVGCRYALLENVPGLLNSGYFPEILRSLAEAGFDARWTVLGADDCFAPHRRKRLWVLAYSNAGRIQSEEEVRAGRDTFDDGSPYVADPDSPREQQPTWDNEESRGWFGDSGEDVADSISKQNHRKRKSGESGRDSVGWHPETAQRNEREASTDSLNRLGEDVADSDSEGSQGFRRQPESVSEQETRYPIGGGHQENQSNRWPTEPDVGRVAHGVAHRVDRLKAIGNGQVPRVAATAWEILTDESNR